MGVESEIAATYAIGGKGIVLLAEMSMCGPERGSLYGGGRRRSQRFGGNNPKWNVHAATAVGVRRRPPP